jgi:hypothetical protein
MHKTQLALAGLLLGSPLLGLAQEASPAPLPRFYGGLGLYTSIHHNLSSRGNGTHIPVQAVVGYQLRPRLAVQLGVAYSGNRYTYDGQSAYYNSGTLVAYPIGTYRERNSTTSLLARYTLTRKLQHRFQADLLGGAKLEHSAYHDEGTYFDNTQATPSATPYEYASTYNRTLLGLGVSLRYRLVSRLEAVYDLTFDQPVSRNTSYNLRPAPTMALGLRYRFSQ